MRYMSVKSQKKKQLFSVAVKKIEKMLQIKAYLAANNN